MAFDPDQYLSESSTAVAEPTGFDPDSYIKGFDPDSYVKNSVEELAKNKDYDPVATAASSHNDPEVRNLAFDVFKHRYHNPQPFSVEKAKDATVGVVKGIWGAVKGGAKLAENAKTLAQDYTQDAATLAQEKLTGNYAPGALDRNEGEESAAASEIAAAAGTGAKGLFIDLPYAIGRKAHDLKNWVTGKKFTDDELKDRFDRMAQLSGAGQDIIEKPLADAPSLTQRVETALPGATPEVKAEATKQITEDITDQAGAAGFGMLPGSTFSNPIVSGAAGASLRVAGAGANLVGKLARHSHGAGTLYGIFHHSPGTVAASVGARVAAPAVGKLLTDAGDAMFTGQAIKGGLLRQGAGKVAQAMATGGVVGSGFALGAESPEEAVGSVLGGIAAAPIFMLDNINAGKSRVQVMDARAEAAETQAMRDQKFAPLMEAGQAIPRSVGGHDQGMALLSKAEQDRINLTQGFLAGHKNALGEQIEVVTLPEDQYLQTDGAKPGTRGYVGADGNIYLNAGSENQPGGADRTLRHETGHVTERLAEIIGGDFKENLASSITGKLYDTEGEPIPEFKKFIGAYQREIGGRISREQAEHEFVAETVSKILENKGIEDFAIAPTIGERIREGASDAMKGLGLAPRSKDGIFSWEEIPAITRRMRGILKEIGSGSMERAKAAVEGTLEAPGTEPGAPSEPVQPIQAPVATPNDRAAVKAALDALGYKKDSAAMANAAQGATVEAMIKDALSRKQVTPLNEPQPAANLSNLNFKNEAAQPPDNVGEVSTAVLPMPATPDLQNVQAPSRRPGTPETDQVEEARANHPSGPIREHIDTLDANRGKVVWIKGYDSAQKIGESTAESDRAEDIRQHGASKRKQGESGTIQDKPFIPTEIRVNKNGEAYVNGFDVDVMLSNLRHVTDFMRENKIKNPLTSDKAIEDALETYNYNHANGFDGAGLKRLSKPGPDYRMPDANQDAAPRPLHSDPATARRIADMLNMAVNSKMSDVGATEGSKAQALNLENFGFRNEAGETNSLRADLEAAGFDTSKNLSKRSAFYGRLAADLIREGVSTEPVAHGEGGRTVRPHGFDIDLNRAFGPGKPQFEAVAAGFMPKSRGGKETTSIKSKLDEIRFMPKSKAQEEYEARISDPQKLVDEFKNESGVPLLNGDDIIAASPDMQNAKPKDMLHVSGEIYPTAKRLRDAAYTHLLSKPPEGTGQVLIMAGGMGSGKSTIARLMETPEFIYDTNLADLADAKRKIDQAIEAGRGVKVALVARDPGDAMLGNLKRALVENRVGHADQLGNNNAVARANVKALAEHYKGNPAVDIVAYKNETGKAPELVDLADVEDFTVDAAKQKAHNTLHEVQSGKHPGWSGDILTQDILEAAGGGQIGSAEGPGPGGAEDRPANPSGGSLAAEAQGPVGDLTKWAGDAGAVYQGESVGLHAFKELETGGNFSVKGTPTPEQIKAKADAVRASFLKGSQFMPSSELGFYSGLRKAAEERLPERASAAQVKATLDPAKGGVKKEELEFIGLPQFLEGKQNVTKQEVLDFIDTHSVKLGEVIKGAPSWSGDHDAAQSAFEKVGIDFTVTDDGTPYFRNKDGDDLEYDSTMNKRQRAVYENFFKPISDTPKFSQYSLPGGKNYNEVLITLPQTDQSIAEVTKGWTVREGEGDPASGPVWEVRNARGTWVLGVPRENGITADQAIRRAVERGENWRSGNTVFKSGHWNESNVLAHIRQADHVDTEGNKVRLIEELQSDWHQKGRKEGYAVESNPGLFSTVEEGNKWVVKLDGKPYAEGATREEALKNWEAEEAKDKVPDAPFKKTWHELAFKKALSIAVRDDMDKIAWTPGDQQAERYDLSKTLSRIDYKKSENGDVFIRPVDLEGQYLKDIEGSYPQSKLSDVIGKEVAQQIIGSEESKGQISGDNLKVGGSGMRGFYDKILPDFVRKYVKPWGGKVETTQVKTHARDYQQFKGKDGRDDEFTTVHSVTITPEMRKAVEAGQPMFMPESKTPNEKDKRTGQPTFIPRGQLSAEESQAASEKLREDYRRYNDAARRASESDTDEAFNEVADSLPFVTLEKLGIRKDPEHFSGFNVIPGEEGLKFAGRGGESTTFLDGDVAYKIFAPQFNLETGRPDGIGITADITKDPAIGWRMEYTSGTIGTTLEKLNVMSRIGGVPSEVVGVTPGGALVIKQPAHVAPAHRYDGDKLIGKYSALALAGAHRPARLPIDFEQIVAVDGKPYFLSDLTKSNFALDNAGDFRIADAVIAPVPEEMLAEMPQLKQLTDALIKAENPDRANVSYMPETIDGKAERLQEIEREISKLNWNKHEEQLSALLQERNDIGNALRRQEREGATETQEDTGGGEGVPRDAGRDAPKGAVPYAHWSRSEGLETLDPSYHGKGAPGAESKRRVQNPDRYVDRIYLGVGDYKREPALPGNKYTGSLDESLIYDLAKDPLDLAIIAHDMAKNDGDLNRTTEYERLIKEHGYLGYRSGDVVAVFHPIPTNGHVGPDTFAKNAPEYARRSPEMMRALRDYVPHFDKIEEDYFRQKPADDAQVAKQSEIAKAYDDAQLDNLKDPKVRRAYDALAEKINEQYDRVLEGVDVEPWADKQPDGSWKPREGQPYKSSADMQADIKDGHLYFFTTTPESFGSNGNFSKDHPMIQESGKTTENGYPLLNNDILRAVHDAIAHGAFGLQFGPGGEEAAWRVHAATISDPWARWALTTETRGQNSWVNFNEKHLNRDGTVKKKGDPGYVPPTERPFADQKTDLLDPRFMLTGDRTVDEVVTNNPEFREAAGLPASMRDASGKFMPTKGTGRIDPIEDLSKAIPEFKEALGKSAKVREGYTIGEHTEAVRKNLMEQARHYDLAGISERNNIDANRAIQYAVALHDIGKSRDGAQHKNTGDLIDEYANGINSLVPSNEVSLIKELVTHDLIGQMARGNISADRAISEIKDRAKASGIEPSDFLAMNELLYASDAGSYPTVREKLFAGQDKWELEGPNIEKLRDGVSAPENLSSFMPKSKRGEEGLREFNFGAKFTPAALNQQAVKRRAVTAQDKFPEAVPPTYRKENGKFIVDEKGRPKAEKLDYNLFETPLAKDAAKGLRGDDKRKEAVAQAYSQKLVEEFDRTKDKPEIMAGKEWYELARKKIKKHFGKDSLLFAQLLGATSARTPVAENFAQALEAYNQLKAGAYKGHAERYLDLENKLENGEDLRFQETYSKEVDGKQTIINAGEPVTPTNFKFFLDQQGVLPKKSNGREYNANSLQVLRVIAGNWEKKIGGPKTPNFARNLSGVGDDPFAATIDVWAARNLHRLGNEGRTTKRWRITPESEQGVTDPDFFLGQEAYRKAAKELGMNPDSLQAVLWFAEKQVWEERGWTRGAGAELSDFNVLLDKTVDQDGKKVIAKAPDPQQSLF